MIEEQKKEYTAPELTVVEMQRQALLFDGSCAKDEYCGEM